MSPSGPSAAPFSLVRRRQRRRALGVWAQLVGATERCSPGREGRAALGTGRACRDSLGTVAQSQLLPALAQLRGAGAGPILP